MTQSLSSYCKSQNQVFTWSWSCHKDTLMHISSLPALWFPGWWAPCTFHLFIIPFLFWSRLGSCLVIGSFSLIMCTCSLFFLNSFVLFTPYVFLCLAVHWSSDSRLLLVLICDTCLFNTEMIYGWSCVVTHAMDSDCHSWTCSNTWIWVKSLDQRHHETFLQWGDQVRPEDPVRVPVLIGAKYKSTSRGKWITVGCMLWSTLVLRVYHH